MVPTTDFWVACCPALLLVEGHEHVHRLGGFLFVSVGGGLVVVLFVGVVLVVGLVLFVGGLESVGT